MQVTINPQFRVGQDVWWLRMADNADKWVVHPAQARVGRQWNGLVEISTYMGVQGCIYRTVLAEWVFASRAEARAEAKRRNGGEE